MLAFIILCLLIQNSCSFELPQWWVDDVTAQKKDERNLKSFHTVDTKSKEDFSGYARHAYNDEETEARKKTKELEPTSKTILSIAQRSTTTNTETDNYGEEPIFFLRNAFQNWFQKLWNRPSTTTTTTTTPSTTEEPPTTKVTPTTTKSNIDIPIKDEASLSKIMRKLSSTLEHLTKILGDKESEDGLVCVRVASFEDATRRRRKKRQAESTEAKNSQKSTSPYRIYYLRKANRTLQSDNQVNVTPKNIHLEEVRDKLYSYIDDKFKDVIKNAAPLQNLRNDLGENSGFKIGYLIANLDVLIENIRKLKADTDSKRDMFEEELFLDTFNKLQSAFQVVGNIEMTVNKTLNDMKV